MLRFVNVFVGLFSCCARLKIAPVTWVFPASYYAGSGATIWQIRSTHLDAECSGHFHFQKWFHTCITLIAYIVCNNQWIFLIFVTKVKKTTTFCSRNGYCQILVTFWATWRQNFDNFFLGHTVYRNRKKHCFLAAAILPFYR